MAKNNNYNLPILHESKPEQPFVSIMTDCGKRFYATNLQNEYRYYERMAVIMNCSNYLNDLSNPYPKNKAYYVLLWHLFGDYLDAYRLPGISSNIKSNYKGDIYIIRNSLGFIKIGRTKNIAIRLIDLKYEFDGNFQIIKIYKGMGHKESEILNALSKYQYPVIKRWTNKFSVECFEDNEKILQITERILQ